MNDEQEIKINWVKVVKDGKGRRKSLKVYVLVVPVVSISILKTKRWRKSSHKKKSEEKDEATKISQTK